MKLSETSQSLNFKKQLHKNTAKTLRYVVKDFARFMGLLRTSRVQKLCRKMQKNCQFVKAFVFYYNILLIRLKWSVFELLSLMNSRKKKVANF